MHELKTARFVMMTEPSLVKRIDDWRRLRQIDSRAAAVRELIEDGLAAKSESPAAAPTAPGQVPSNPTGNEDEREK